MLSVAIIPAEAIPFIGPFTIVAVTGLEIKDACATMEDLRELNGLLDTGGILIQARFAGWMFQIWIR